MTGKTGHTGRHFLFVAGTVSALALMWFLILSSITGEAKKKTYTPNILKSRSVGININHVFHVSRLKMSCEACHKGAASSKKASQFLVPDNKACLSCHPDATCKGDFVESCFLCHDKKPASYTTLRVKHKKSVEVIFPHSKHASGNTNEKKCLVCHVLKDKKNPVKGIKNNPGLPDMKQCLGCHNHLKEYEALLCDVCHFKKKDGTIKTKLSGAVVLKPPSWMSGMKHDGLWYKEHEATAANHALLCAACHTNDDCDRCHAGTGELRPSQLHPDDWIMLHGYSSLSGDLHCTSCHNLQHFCLPCHRKSGLAWDSPPGINVPSGAVFHPEGWYSFSGGNRHGIEARHSLGSCVSCHTEYDCMLCHAAPFQTFNPHPPSSLWHKKCRTLYSKNPGVCYKCHSIVPAICK